MTYTVELVKCNACGHELRDHVFQRCVGESLPGVACWCRCKQFKLDPAVAKREAHRVLIPEFTLGAKVAYYGPVLAYIISRDSAGRPRGLVMKYDNDPEPSGAVRFCEPSPMRCYLRASFVTKEE